MNKAPRATPPSSITWGTVVAVFGRRLEVDDETGAHLDYVSHGNQWIAVCGERVEFNATSAGAAVIKKLLPRRNYLERSDVYKRNAIAANVNQVLILAAIEPRASEEFIARVNFVRLGPDHRQSADDYDP